MDMVKGWVDSVQSDPGFAMAHSVCHMAGVIVIIFTRAIINFNPSHHRPSSCSVVRTS